MFYKNSIQFLFIFCFIIIILFFTSERKNLTDPPIIFSQLKGKKETKSYNY